MQASDATMAVAYATAILTLFMWFCGTITTYVRGRSMESPNQEDGAVIKFFNRVFFVPVTEFSALPDNNERDAATNRWVRITTNNTANIPAALLVFFLAAQLAALDTAILVPLIWVFVVARFAHTFFYAMALQPLRTASYSVGATCMMIAAISVVTTA